MNEERVQRLRRRFDDAQLPEEPPDDEAPEDDAPETVRERPSVLMYLPPDVREELDVRYDELNARYRREHGEQLGKNRAYYPAVVHAGLTGEPLEDLLEL